MEFSPEFVKFVTSNSRPTTTRAQLVEQRFGVLQVGGVEALGEPAIDFREHRARFVAGSTGIAGEKRFSMKAGLAACGA